MSVAAIVSEYHPITILYFWLSCIDSMADPRESYQSPLNSRYASTEMKYNFSEKKKFSEWRKLWVILAKAQKELGVQYDGRDITDEQVLNS